MNRKERRAANKSAPAAQRPSAAVGALTAEAMSLHQRGALAEAAAAYRRVLVLTPKNPDVWFNLAVASKAAGRLDDAIAAYGQAINLRATDADAHNNLGVALREKGKLAKAVAAHHRAVVLRPDWPEALYNLAVVLAEDGALAAAAAAYHRAATMAPGWAEAHFGLGLALVGAGPHHLGEAAQAFHRAATLKPSWPLAHHSLGNALFEQGLLDRSIEAYGKALELVPRQAESHYRLAAALKARGRLAEALDHLQRAVQLDSGHAQARQQLGITLWDLGRRAEAAAVFESALAADPNDAEAHRFLGTILAEQGQTEGAVRHYQACIAGDPQDRLGARLLLAAIGDAPLPEQTSQAHLLRVYRERAARDGWVSRLDTYFAPAIVAGRLAELVGENRLDILDAGCGSGFVGPLVKAMARRLDGVDLSAEMLGHAKLRDVYDGLYCQDLVPFLDQRPEQYDAVLAVGTLIHFGDLHRVFDGAARALRDDGLFVFTLLTDADLDRGYRLARSFEYASGGCYEHHRDHVRDLALADAHWSVEFLDPIEHERQRDGRPRPGLVVALRRLPRPS